MALSAHRILIFLLYPWKLRILKAFQIRLVSYILILILLSPPPWIDGRSTGGSRHLMEPDTVQNSHVNTEQNTNGLSRFILDMYEVLNGNNRAKIASNNTFFSRFLGPEHMRLVHSADTVRSFYNHNPSEPTEIKQGLSLNFDISSIHHREMVKFTELRVWKSETSNSTLISLLSNKTISRQCLLLELVATERRGHDPERERSFVVGRLRLKPRDLKRTEYLSLHSSRLTKRLAIWPRAQAVKLTLDISSHCNSRIDLSDLGISDLTDTDPLLLVYTIMKGNDGYNDIPVENIPRLLRKRSERNTEGSSANRGVAPWLQDGRNPNNQNPSSNCQRYSNVIDIADDLGWDEWVVYPRSFDAFYCYGQCQYPIPSRFNSTNHALIQALIHISNPEKAPPVCCVPTQFQELSFLYRQNTSLVLKKYKNMIALSCGCR